MAEIRLKYRVTSGLMSGVTPTHGAVWKCLLTNCEGSSGNKNYITFFLRCLPLQRKWCLILKINYQLYFISDNWCLRPAPSCVCYDIWAAGISEVCYDKEEGGKEEGQCGARAGPRLWGVEVLCSAHEKSRSFTGLFQNFCRLMSDSWKGKVE